MCQRQLERSGKSPSGPTPSLSGSSVPKEPLDDAPAAASTPAAADTLTTAAAAPEPATGTAMNAQPLDTSAAQATTESVKIEPVNTKPSHPSEHGNEEAAATVDEPAFKRPRDSY